MRGAAVAVIAAATLGCATLSPPLPRFVQVYRQRTGACTIQVLKDTRAPACFVAFRCGRHPPAIVAVSTEVCVP